MDRIDGRYLKDLREKSGYSLRALAEMIYVSKSSVHRWEQTEVPEFDDIREKLAKIFNVSVEEMCRQSNIKYGCDDHSDIVDTGNELPDNELSSERRAELKFGTKWIVFPVVLLAVFAVLSIITLLF